MQMETVSTRLTETVEDVRPIRMADDHRWALAEIDRYVAEEPAVGTPDGNRFEVLSILIAAHEERTFPIAEADPIEILQFAFAAMGHAQAELGHLLGSRARASEILSRKRPLTLARIRVISEAWHLPIAVLAAP